MKVLETCSDAVISLGFQKVLVQKHFLQKMSKRNCSFNYAKNIRVKYKKIHN
jgi:hypothetical protein